MTNEEKVYEHLQVLFARINRSNFFATSPICKGLSHDVIENSKKLIEDSKEKLKKLGFNVKKYLESSKFQADFLLFQHKEEKEKANVEQCNKCINKWFKGDEIGCYSGHKLFIYEQCPDFVSCGLDSMDRQLQCFKKCWTCKLRKLESGVLIHCSKKHDEIRLDCHFYVEDEEVS